jgi:hypothetical protein
LVDYLGRWTLLYNSPKFLVLVSDLLLCSFKSLEFHCFEHITMCTNRRVAAVCIFIPII